MLVKNKLRRKKSMQTKYLKAAERNDKNTYRDTECIDC